MSDMLAATPRAPRHAVIPTSTLTELDLEPGDVLLARGVGEVSDAICALDGGDYSHAAFWDGANVVEATQEGVRKNTLEGLLSHRRFTDAYRFRKGGHVLGDEGWPPEPVIRAVHGYVGGDYAAAELLLMGLLIASSRRVTSPVARLAIRLLGGPAARKLQEWLDARAKQGKRSLVCTQVVTSGYYDAAPDHAYAIQVAVGELREAVAVGAAPLLASAAEESVPADPALESDLQALRSSCDRLVSAALPRLGASDLVLAASPASAAAPEMAAETLAGAVTMSAGSGLLPVVTPRELQASPTLSLVGRLAQPSAALAGEARS